MARPGLFINYNCTAKIEPHRIVTIDSSADFTVAQASDVSQPIAGVSDHGSTGANRVDVIHDHTAHIVYGGDIAPGDAIVADANGKGVKFDVANHVEDALIWVVGIAQESGALGTIGTVAINPFLIVK